MVTKDQSLLLKVDGLSVQFSFKNQHTTILENVSFSLNDGEVLGITGYSGSGKSMTALSIMGLASYLDNIKVSGSIVFDNLDIIKAKESELSRIRGSQMSMVIQQPMEAFDPVMKLRKQLEYAVTIHHPQIPKKELEIIICNTLEDVGLKNVSKFLDSYPHELSGGQLQRVAIAMAIINKPKLLIADEPTSSLDAELSAEINDLLFQLVRSRNMSMIYISHNLAMIASICDKILIIEKGNIITSESLKTKDKNDVIAEYLNQEITVQDRLHCKIEATEKLNVSNVSKTYTSSSFLGFKKKQYKVLSEINFAVNAGEMVGILGPSGSGKSTLAKIIAGLISSDSGSLSLNGEIYDKFLLESNKRFRRKIQMLLQSSFSSLQPKMTVEQQWKEAYDLHEDSNSEKFKVEINGWLAETGLPQDILSKYPSQLSGGQQQRAALVRTLIVKPEFMIFDESLSALDIKHQNMMVSLITKLQEKFRFGGIFITHDRKLANAICHQIYSINDGLLQKTSL